VLLLCSAVSEGSALSPAGGDPGRGPVWPQHTPHVQGAGQWCAPVRQRLGPRLRGPRQEHLAHVHRLPAREAGWCRGVERTQEKWYQLFIAVGGHLPVQGIFCELSWRGCWLLLGARLFWAG